MTNRNIHITEHDISRLREVLEDARRQGYEGSEYLDSLRAELERATIVPPKEIPPDVITMNTRVRLIDLDTNDEEIYTLVFPDEADISQGKISVLSPIGTAMLGYRLGDIFEWEVPAGKVHMKVAEILYQPEASGDYDL